MTTTKADDYERDERERLLDDPKAGRRYIEEAILRPVPDALSPEVRAYIAALVAPRKRCQQKHAETGEQCVLDDGHFPETKHRIDPSKHRCHAMGCMTACKPEHLMCAGHWAMVPRNLQQAVYATYRHGQCDGGDLPSDEWHDAADAAIRAVAVKEGRITP